MPDAIITSTESTFGTISGTFAADQSTVTGTISGIITGTLDGSVGVPGPVGPTGPQGPQGEPGEGVPAGGLAGQFLQKTTTGVDYATDWVTLNLSAYAPLNSPLFTGDPRGPTAALGDNDTSLATTAFVQQELASGVAVAKNLEVFVRNQTGSTIAAGSIVYISGATGNKPLITLAQANNDANSAQTMGFVKTAIADNGTGYVIVRGEVENLDTSALTEGVQLYLSPTTPGAWTTTKPSAPQHMVYVGIVIRSHPTQGIILVAVMNGLELEELHNVAISSPTNGQVLKYDSATNLWKNQTDLNSGVWGSITGTLSSQTDLQSALNAKQNVSAMSDYLAKADNLSGLANVATSRTNLGLGTANTVQFTEVRAFGSEYKSYVTTFGFTNSRTYSGPSGTIVNYGILTSDDGINLVKEIGNPAQATATVKAGDGMVVNDGDGSQMTFGSTGITFPDATTQTTAFPGFAGYATESFVTSQGYITSSALTGYATESWVTSQGYLTASSLTPYLTKADNLGSLTNFATARDNLGLGSLNTPTFAGVNVPGSGTSVANLGATSLTINQDGHGQFTIQPSQGIVFPDTTIQTTAVNATVLGDYLTKAGNLSGLASTSTARTNLGLGTLATVNDAPSDGNEYVRKNAAWSIASGGGSSYITSVSSPLSVTSSNLTIDLSAYAPLASPTFTGTPSLPTGTTAVTQSLGDNSTKVATTAFVIANAGGGGGGGGVDVQTFGSPTTSGSFTWTKPAGAKFVEIYLWGGGAGGGCGARQATTVDRAGGQGGGSGTFYYTLISADSLSSTETVVVGAGSAGRAGRTNIGNPLVSVGGNNTTFSSFRAAGGSQTGSAQNSVYTLAFASGGGGGAGTTSNGSNAANQVFIQMALGGGGGGGATANITTARTGGNGGGYQAGNPSGLIASVAGGTGGTAAGVQATSGVTEANPIRLAGTGGGGGFYISGQNGGDGGNGGWPAAGGGGGGAADDTATRSGNGGNGANGFACIITYT